VFGSTDVQIVVEFLALRILAVDNLAPQSARIVASIIIKKREFIFPNFNEINVVEVHMHDCFRVNHGRHFKFCPYSKRTD